MRRRLLEQKRRALLKTREAAEQKARSGRTQARRAVAYSGCGIAMNFAPKSIYNGVRSTWRTSD